MFVVVSFVLNLGGGVLSLLGEYCRPSARNLNLLSFSLSESRFVAKS